MKLSRVVAVRSLVVGSLAEQGRAGQRTMFQPWQPTVLECPKSENHRKTIESNGLGAENH